MINTFALKVERYNGKITSNLEAADPVIFADEMHLTNVIFNLMDNAVKYKKAEEDLELIRSNGLRVCGAYGDIKNPEEVIKAARLYGASVVGMPSIPGEMMRSPDGFHAYAEQINAWAKPFKGTGIRLQYHNHSQEFRNFPELDGKSGMDILIDETDPETVAFELDVFWASAAGCCLLYTSDAADE